MKKTSKYISRPINADGNIDWTEAENKIWQELVTRQLDVLSGRACNEFLSGLELLQLPHDRIPQLHEINRVLLETTGWQIEQVSALINFDEFFRLLSEKKFPVATFIRTREEFDYLQEPDIFHEIFGHCPLLTNPAFAHFTHVYGKLGYAASKEDRVYLARLYWFTVEFGLVSTSEGDRIYGGGILSSPGESVYALESDEPERHLLEVMDVLRTPYRIDIMQPVYYKLREMQQLFELADMDIPLLVNKAKRLGLYSPKFEPKQKIAS
jgi:phenylalanine-4-hydroxylase